MFFQDYRFVHLLEHSRSWSRRSKSLISDAKTVDDCVSQAYLVRAAQFAVWNNGTCFHGQFEEEAGTATPVVDGIDLIYVKAKGERRMDLWLIGKLSNV